MSFDQTGTHACFAPCVTRPLPAKKSTKVERICFNLFFWEVFKGGVKLKVHKFFDSSCQAESFQVTGCKNGQLTFFSASYLRKLF